MKARTRRRPARLHTRIALHFGALAVVLVAILSFGAWRVLTETEDAVLDRYLLTTLPVVRASRVDVAWLEEFESEASLQQRLPLDPVPYDPGWHTVFRSSETGRAQLVRSWRDTIVVWSQGLEEEYRLLVSYSEQGVVTWTVVDLAPLEFTEDRMPELQGFILALALATLMSAGLMSARLARSAMRPVVTLTERLSQLAGSRSAPESNGALAANLAEDEVAVLARALDEAWSQERRSLDLERRFIAECSHELRTPLAILHGTLTLLEETTEDARRAELHARLQRTARRLEGVVQTFLVLAREERRRGERHPVPLAPLLQEILHEQSTLFPHRTLAVVVHVPSAATVEGDRDVLLVLLRNLLQNVYQHSLTDRLVVSWRDAGGPHLVLEEAAIRTTTQPDSAPGFGIGLPLVRRLVDLEGWRLEERPEAEDARRHTLWFDPESS
jgi:signal transduction histidine kinase